MTVMVGGRDADFAQSRPLFEAIAANVFHVGPSGAGCAAKLVTQYLGYTGFIAALEGMLVAAKAGIDLDVLAQIVPVSAGQSRTFDNIPRGVLTRSFAAGGTLDIVAKDMDLAVALCPRGRGAGVARRARPRCLQARPGAGLGRRGVSGRRPDTRSDGGGGTQIGRIADDGPAPRHVWIPARLGLKYAATGLIFPIVGPTKDRVRPAVAFAV